MANDPYAGTTYKTKDGRFVVKNRTVSLIQKRKPPKPLDDQDSREAKLARAERDKALRRGRHPRT